MKNKIRNKKIEATAAIITVVMTAVVVGSLPAIVADDIQGTPVYDGAVTVTLTATDDYSGVKATYYAVDPFFPGETPDYDDITTLYDGPFNVSTPGHRKVFYYSEDVAGNKEAIKLTEFDIYEDITPPVTNCTLDGNLHYGGPTP